MSSLRANLLARHAAHDAELTRRRQLVLADLASVAPPPAASPVAERRSRFVPGLSAHLRRLLPNVAERRSRFVPPPAPRLRQFAATLWRELFVAARPAWLGLACVWLLLLALAAADRAPASPALANTSRPASAPAPLVAWSERERALAALLAPAPAPPVRLAPPQGAPTSFLAPRRASFSAA